MNYFYDGLKISNNSLKIAHGYSIFYFYMIFR